ncbi:MAG: hypothetical protein A3H98_14685 [Bacteroidetes bacterium RIFCSPLOWO2_02_FULL_36_8]|nr:MAG: hypothetical protein A3H98_14685 [Bacteroidetes bacterium RIFCSPLOWO2_02_FULL_36_8]OFY71590.1 MAG: hypothetical protein A3G23_02575 [Bacteroidetes bacterium RIFCSPLOWO2_12_FULL_37_12]
MKQFFLPNTGSRMLKILSLFTQINLRTVFFTFILTIFLFSSCKDCNLPPSSPRAKLMYKKIDYRNRCFELSNYLNEITVKLIEPELQIQKDTVHFTLEYKVPCDIAVYTFSPDIYLYNDSMRFPVTINSEITVKPCQVRGKNQTLSYQKIIQKSFFIYREDLFDTKLLVILRLKNQDGLELQRPVDLALCCNDYIELAEPTMVPFIWGVIKPYQSDKTVYKGDMTFSYNKADLKTAQIKDFVIRELDPEFFFSSTVERINIESYASIEGDSAYNDSLSKMRGKEAREYILKKLNEFRDLDVSKVEPVIVGRGEAWEIFIKKFKKFIRENKDSTFTKELTVLLSRKDLKRDDFEREIKRFKIYDRIKEEILPDLRKAFFDITVVTNPIAYKNLKKIKNNQNYYTDSTHYYKLKNYLNSLNIHNLDVVLLVTYDMKVKWMVSEILLERYPEELLFHINKGFLYLMDGKYEEGKAYFEKIINKGYSSDRYSFLIPYLINYALAYLEFKEYNDDVARCYWDEMKIVDKNRRPLYHYTQVLDKLVWAYRAGVYNKKEPIPSYRLPKNEEYMLIQEYYANMHLLNKLLNYEYKGLDDYVDYLIKSKSQPLVGNGKFLNALLLAKKKKRTPEDVQKIQEDLTHAVRLNPRIKKLIERNIWLRKFRV